MHTAKLIAKTQPVIEGLNNLEEYVAYVARVSNPDDQMNNETSGKLLSYLIRNKHWSPFEMASITMEIKTTRDIGRQILRHRSFSFQEFSGRYAVYDLNEIPYRQARLQDQKNRQNSIKTDDQSLQDWFDMAQYEVATCSIERYQLALKYGIAKEQARALLPEGLTPTTIYMAGTIRSWIHYVAERRKHGVVQLEHVWVAEQETEILKNELPSLEEFLKNV